MRTANKLLALMFAVPALVSAQAPSPRDVRQQFDAERWTVEGTYSRMWLPRPYPQDWATTNAMGARVMWTSAPRALDQARPFVTVGAQFSVTPRKTMDFGRYRIASYGGVVDFLPLGRAYRIDPILSLWGGVVRSRIEDQRLPSSIMNLPEGTTTEFAAAPSLGLRLRLIDRLGVRADYRHTVMRHRRWHGMPEFASGLSLSL